MLAHLGLSGRDNKLGDCFEWEALRTQVIIRDFPSSTTGVSTPCILQHSYRNAPVCGGISLQLHTEQHLLELSSSIDGSRAITAAPFWVLPLL